MLNREEIIRDVEKNKIIVIMRGFTRDQLLNAVEAMEKGGIRLVEVTFDQTGKVSDEKIAEAVNRVFDLRPLAIIDTLGLRNPIYRKTSNYGHMGRENMGFKWEEIDKTEELLKAIN